MFASATELASRIRSGETTSSQVVADHLEQIKKRNDSLRAVILLLEEAALAEAAQCDREAAAGQFRGPLHGVPMTIKEQFWLKGQRSTLNSKRLRNWVAPADAQAVTRLRQAGAIIMGKTNVPLNLVDYQVQGQLFPEGKSPYNLEYTPGGSSGGAAAALASGMTPLELGGDFGGSIRIPANYCGVYGLKTTESTIPNHGGGPVPEGSRGQVWHMAVAGPMARTPEDLELAWKVLRGSDPDERTVARIDWRDAGGKSLADYRIAWVDQWPGFPTSAQTSSVIAAFVRSLSGHGASLANDAPTASLHRRSLELYVRLFPQIIAQEVPRAIRPLMKAQLKRGLLKGQRGFDTELRQGFHLGFKNYAETMTRRAATIGEWERYFADHDLLICPMSYGPAFKRCPVGTPIPGDSGSMPYLNYAWPFVACFNATGHPGINIPLGLNEQGLPIGVQVVGPYWSEPDLIQFAKLVAGFTPGFVPPPGF